MAVVALWPSNDLLLSLIAPIGLAATRRQCLVIDLEANGPAMRAPFSLADLVRDGPTRAQLEPTGPGVAILPNGGVSTSDASTVVSALAQRWPDVVLRCDPSLPPPRSAVCLVPLLPEPFTPMGANRIVYQQLGFPVDAPAGSLVLPRPSRPTVDALVALRAPPGRSRWLRKLSTIWSTA
ncbi:MAG: hypothetical protein R2823_08850 [Acidimicrobiia bacterium]